MTGDRPALLILSFSTLVADARLLKQIRALAREHTVTTCGYGPAPIHGVEHIEVMTSGTPPLWVRRVQGVLLRLRAYRAVYWLHPHYRETRRSLQGRRFAAVLANDLDAARIAYTVVSPDRVHLDLHEYWPGVHDNVAQWRKLRAPYYRWQLSTWAKRAASATTVNREIADLYEQEFGFGCGVVTNASEFRELEGSPVHTPLRLVHSGGARPNRQIELMMRAVARSEADVTLDLYLMGEGTPYYDGLMVLAHELGERVRVLPPVPHARLVETLQDYDLGMPFLPPTTTNIRLCLPNKFFDYVQARLGILTGPTPPMMELLEQYDLGIGTTDFSEDSLVHALEALDAEQVHQWKVNAHRAAEELSAERQELTWMDAVAAIVRTGGVRG